MIKTISGNYTTTSDISLYIDNGSIPYNKIKPDTDIKDKLLV